jgi:hypothetical protein
MRSHVDTLAGRQLSRPHLVEEDERPDVSPLGRRQDAADFKSADVAGTRLDDRFERPAGRERFYDGLFRR